MNPLYRNLVVSFLFSITSVQAEVLSLSELRRADVTVQKFDNSCGAAAESTLLNLKFGYKIKEKDVAIGLISRQEYINNPDIIKIRQGFSLLDLKRVTQTLHFKAEAYGDMTLKDLLEIAPAIVPINAYGYNHFVVFRGISDNDKIVLADPAYGNRTMSTERFMNIWINYPEKVGRIAFTIGKQ